MTPKSSAALARAPGGGEPPGPPLFENLVLNYEKLTKILGIPRRTLERMVSRNEIPHRKVRNYVIFYWPAIEE